jgi:hypothetical protein
MYKHLLRISLAMLSCHAIAEKITEIKTAEGNKPVHIGIFRGSCKFDFTKLQTSADFPSLEGPGCQYVTDQTLDPRKPKASLKTWHQGAAPLTLVAFQSGAPVDCLIRDEYKTMYVLSGPQGLTCTSPEAQSDETEEEEVEKVETVSGNDGENSDEEDPSDVSLEP